MKRNILLLGDPRLYQTSIPVEKDELTYMQPVIQDLHDTLMEFRKQHNAGRAIAAPQIGVQKRIIYMCIDEPVVFINPVLEFIGDEVIEVLDDCMSFPQLLVKVIRYQKCKVKFRDLEWKEREIVLEDDLSELIQHEYDHLDGIVATMRAIDNQSFFIKGYVTE